MKNAIMLTMFMAVGSLAFGLDPSLKRVDDLDAQGHFEQARTVLLNLLPSMTTPAQKAEVYWRLSREQLGIGDNEKDAKKSNDVIVATYEKGQQYGDKAIEAAPDNPEGYFWKSGNLGKIGLLRGPLNSLGMIPTLKELLQKTIELNPKDEKAYYALGQLYAKAPGWPLSFGDIDHAVSLARKAVYLLDRNIASGDTQNTDYGFYIELARDLHQRNWDAGHRDHEQAQKREKYASETNVLEKNFYFEGTLPIPQESDRAEALQIARKAVSMIEAKQEPLTERDRTELAEARQLISNWQGVKRMQPQQHRSR